MNLQKTITTLLFLALTVSSFSQQDLEAKKILDMFSKKTKSYHAYKADFTIVNENRQNHEKTENKGSFLVKGDKYKMELDKTEIYFDGKYIYNYIPASNEVSISKPGKKSDDLFANNPSKLFNIISSDYKYQYLGNLVENNRNCYEVDLYPFDLKKKYSIIKLLIDIDKLELVLARMIMKSGVDYTVKIDKFNGQASVNDTDFVFNIKSHKGIEVVDLR
jgi:outer membrane lipoprotein-sorting protein